MSIQHELSSDIAVALLTGEKREPKELNDLKEVVLRIHAVLHQLTTESQTRRSFSRALAKRISMNKTVDT
jgi:hypothetical protein